MSFKLIVVGFGLFLAAPLLFPTLSWAKDPSVLTEAAVYRKIYPLCKLEPTLTGSLSQSARAFRFYWSGIKTVAGNPFRPSPATQDLMNNPGYWKALQDCYGEDTAYQYAFSLAIVLLDEAGTFTDWVFLGAASKAFFGFVRTTRFALAHPKVFRKLGYVLVGTGLASVITQGIATVSKIIEQKHNQIQIEELEGDPTRFIQSVGGDEDQEIRKILEERLTEIRAELMQTSLSESRRAKLLDYENDLQRRLDRRRNEGNAVK